MKSIDGRLPQDFDKSFIVLNEIGKYVRRLRMRIQQPRQLQQTVQEMEKDDTDPVPEDDNIEEFEKV